MKDIIVENYNNFERELKVRLKVEPELAGNQIELTLDSQCDSEVRRGHHEIICQNGTVKTWEKFSLKIKLNPEICDLRPPLENIRIVASVYGQTDSSMDITLGKILRCSVVQCFISTIFLWQSLSVSVTADTVGLWSMRITKCAGRMTLVLSISAGPASVLTTRAHCVSARREVWVGRMRERNVRRRERARSVPATDAASVGPASVTRAGSGNTAPAGRPTSRTAGEVITSAARRVRPSVSARPAGRWTAPGGVPVRWRRGTSAGLAWEGGRGQERLRSTAVAGGVAPVTSASATRDSRANTVRWKPRSTPRREPVRAWRPAF